MNYLWYSTLPPEAAAIRQAVFVEEQGFAEEFDTQDADAWHLVLSEDGIAIGTCRLFWDASTKRWILGRLAVLRTYRGRGWGSVLLTEAEHRARSLGATALWLHAQQQAQPFYEKLGYLPVGAPDEEQGCPHRWMRRVLNGPRPTAE